MRTLMIEVVGLSQWYLQNEKTHLNSHMRTLMIEVVGLSQWYLQNETWPYMGVKLS